YTRYPVNINFYSFISSFRMKERLLELRQILLDRPMSALDTGVWWTEYVLRHKDTKHLRPTGFDQWWYQRRLIDVWAFLFAVALIVAALFVAICVLVTKSCLRSLRITGNTKKIKTK